MQWLDDNYWDQWIDNHKYDTSELWDYKSFYLTIRRLNHPTDPPEDNNKYRLCITGDIVRQKFNSMIEAKEYAKKYIDTRVSKKKDTYQIYMKY